MYERFTNRSRNVMELAKKEAEKLNHNHISSEHLLLGLLGESSGVAANALGQLSIELEAVREEVGKLAAAGPDPAPDRVIPTPTVSRIIDHANTEARNLGHVHIGTEHLLLGLLNEPESVAIQVLLNLGATPQAVRQEVLRLLGTPHEAVRSSPKAVKLEVRHRHHPDLGAWRLARLQESEGFLLPLRTSQGTRFLLVPMLGVVGKHLLLEKAGAPLFVHLDHIVSLTIHED